MKGRPFSVRKRREAIGRYREVGVDDDETVGIAANGNDGTGRLYFRLVGLMVGMMVGVMSGCSMSVIDP